MHTYVYVRLVRVRIYRRMVFVSIFLDVGTPLSAFLHAHLYVSGTLVHGCSRPEARHCTSLPPNGRGSLCEFHNSSITNMSDAPIQHLKFTLAMRASACNGKNIRVHVDASLMFTLQVTFLFSQRPTFPCAVVPKMLVLVNQLLVT